MKDRLYKKRIKKKWKIDKVGRHVDLKKYDRDMTWMRKEFTRRIGEALEEAILYGRAKA